ncbi:MAG: leader peptidase (prepilin peptidase) / N-methyltransferase [Microgenomates group bacterium Gr01-1014_5]|nr:MAG: leader peptidase (prepilin peptidase) / N-methyltransferase [Microgenomates group bacterium Gr01-1014_5]
MTLFEYLTLLIFGLVSGSFLGMLTYRLPRSLHFGGRSYCDHCKRKLSWSENLPLISYLVLKKCRCGKKIPSRYPLIEAATAGFFVLTGFAYSANINSGFLDTLHSRLGPATLPFLLLIVMVLMALAVIDIERQILPDALVYILGLIFAVYFILFANNLLFSHLLWGYLSFLFFLTIYLVTKRRGMGFGDVKLSFVLGSFLGFEQSILWLFGAFTLGAVAGLILLAVRRAKLGLPIPFGPFLLVSFWLTVFYGEKIVGWYLKLL